MEKLDNDTIQRFIRGTPLKEIKDPDELDKQLTAFFNDVRKICESENHTFKWNGGVDVAGLLHDACCEIGLNHLHFTHIEEDGEWYIEGIQYKEDFQNLPVIVKIFSKLYRFQKPISRKKGLNGQRTFQRLIP
jgi:hypothetical protein